MNHLQYKSNEMYSSTDLIRKSKSIFDKLNKKEIEKAIIFWDIWKYYDWIYKFKSSDSK